MIGATLETVVGRIHERLSDDSVEAFAGRVRFAEWKQKRRIGWIWVGGSLSPSQTLSTDHAVLGDNRLLVESHIGAESQGDAEVLWIRALSAVRFVLGSRCEFGAYEWITEVDSRAGRIYGGAAVVVQQMAWTLEMPWAHAFGAGAGAGHARATIRQVDHTCILETDQ